MEKSDMKIIKKILMLSILTNMLFGCMYGAVKITNLDSVRKGMTKHEVSTLLGPPITINQTEDAEYLLYSVWEAVSDTFKGKTTTCYVKYINGVVDKWGKNEVNFDQLQKGSRALFDKSGTKIIEIRFIKFIDLTRWYDSSNRAMNEGYQLFTTLSNSIKQELEQKGYLAEIGPIINVTFPPDSPMGWNPYVNKYFVAIQPYLDSLQIKNADAILIFIIPTFYDFSCYLYDLKSKKVVFADTSSGSQSYVIDKVEKYPLDTWGNRKKVITTYHYTESYKEFLNRLLRTLFLNLPHK
jgi:hypothetical protein